MRFHLPSFCEVKSRSDKICPVEPGRHSAVKAGRKSQSQLKLSLLGGGVLRCLANSHHTYTYFFHYQFMSSWVTVTLSLPCNNVVSNKSYHLPGSLSLSLSWDLVTHKFILGKEVTDQYFLYNLNLILNCDLHLNIFNLEKSDTTADLRSTPSATYDSFTSYHQI